MKNKTMLAGFWILAFLAYGWKGVFWSIPTGIILIHIFWTAAMSNKEKMMEIIKENKNK